MYETLKPVQEKQGYYFNPDEEWRQDVLAGMIKNKERYGYASCPCRLAAGDRERDRDIICPCAFREEDVEKYGACFCKLYMSREGAEGKREIPEYMPDRWLKK